MLRLPLYPHVFLFAENNIDITYFSHAGCVTPRFSKNIAHLFRERNVLGIE